jgi:hypothetical protein
MPSFSGQVIIYKTRNYSVPVDANVVKLFGTNTLAVSANLVVAFTVSGIAVDSRLISDTFTRTGIIKSHTTGIGKV